jgi:hypothetical protein
MAKSMSFVAAALMTLLFASVEAKIVWESSHGASADRRLALGLVNSHNDTNDPKCIVGGYDEETPTRIYVGGPCSQINAKGDPQAGFRWVVMETFTATLVNSKGDEADMEGFLETSGEHNEFQYSEDHSSHAEAGAGMSVYMNEAGVKEAALFLSTTSYLSKSDFTFYNNTFALGYKDKKDKKKGMNWIEGVCVVPCAEKNKKCACKTDAPIPVKKADYKYSILAAAYSVGTGANGWKKVISTYGTGNPKALAGNLNVYQSLDFTNMKADRFTVTAADGTAVKYADMVPCDVDNETANYSCKLYSVKSATVASDDWMGTYAFPMTYNVGEWKQVGKEVKPTHEMTKTVVISCVRPTQANLKKYIKGATDQSKMIWLEYKFDVTGIEGEKDKGKYMVYDPTVTGGKGTPAGTTGAGGTTGGTNAPVAGASATRSFIIQLVLSVAVWLLV